MNMFNDVMYIVARRSMKTGAPSRPGIRMCVDAGDVRFDVNDRCSVDRAKPFYL